MAHPPGTGRRQRLARVFEAPFLARWCSTWRSSPASCRSIPARNEVAERAIYELPLRQWIDIGGTKLTASDFAKVAIDLAKIRLRYPRARASV
jgi:hypothetical protein